MKLTINLARKNVSTMTDLIRPIYLEMENGLEQLPAFETLEFPAIAFIQRDKPTQPKWLGFLGAHFNVSEVHNLTTSVLLILQAHDRIFAVTFGMSALNALDRTQLEHEFGLRVSANTINIDDITTVDTRNLDTVTRQQRTHLSAGSHLSEFSIPLEQDWVRRIQGKTSTLDFAKSLSGSESLHINISSNLSRLPEILGELLAQFESDEYKKNFPFLDYYRPIDKESDTSKQLEKTLTERITARQQEKISLALPQLIDDEQVSHFELYARYRAAELDEITLSGVYAFLDEYYDGLDPLNTVKIMPVSDTGQAAGQKRTLRDWIVCELPDGSKTYVLSLGQWYEVDRDFVREINAGVKLIEDATDHLNMDEWGPKEEEGDYNKRVGKSKKWLVLDKKNYHIGGRYQKIEICDLLTKDMELICVKQQTSSATLSHLFSQGSVSAELYRGEEAYRSRIFSDAAKFWNADIAEPENGPKIIYAVANDREGPLSDTLFFFSKISLLFNARIVQRLGLQVAIARIPMPEGSLRKKKKKRKAATARARKVASPPPA
ncbi:DUF6119 family protein [Streptomyces sp. NPDC051572]|uniref:DUF6119 family protein n=1 Tax=Streptomyces sp. NPDC051572 TaxID=3155802 RepID=UPI00344F79A7